MRFRQHQPGDELLRDLPLAAAPAEIWAGLEAALNAGQRPPVRRRVPFWRAMLAAAACAALAAGVYWKTRPAAPRWQVERVAGTPSIGSHPLDSTGSIREGQWLETDASSQALIHIGAIGTVQVGANTRVGLVAARPSEHRLTLARGRISASVTAPPRLFFVDTPSSTAVDLGCAYSMDVDDAGNGVVHVTLGWVSLESKGRESLIPAGASCRTRAKAGPGTPYFDDASQPLQRALVQIDFAHGGREALDAVLSESRLRDTLTLWHLLSRVDAPDRLRVFQRMAALAPLPNGISSDKVLQLDPETLKRWREELAWKW